MKNIKLVLSMLFLSVLQANAATINDSNEELIAQMSIDKDVISLFENSSRTVLLNYFAAQGDVKFTDDQKIKLNTLKIQNELYRLKINRKYPAYANMNIEEQQKIMYAIGANGLAAASAERVMRCSATFCKEAAECLLTSVPVATSFKALKAAGCFVAAVSTGAAEEIISDGTATPLVAAEAAPVLEGCWGMSGLSFAASTLIATSCYLTTVADLLSCI